MEGNRKDLVEKVEETLVDYKKEIDFSKSAWDAYGSELCVADLDRIVNTAKKKYESALKDLQIFDAVMNGYAKATGDATGRQKYSS
jgi:hypothetical protein